MEGQALRTVLQQVQLHLPSAVVANYRQALKSPAICGFLGISVAGAGCVVASELKRLRKLRKKLDAVDEAAVVNGTLKNKATKKKKTKVGNHFRAQLLTLLKIGLPGIQSKVLLLVQFGLLVLRTLLTVRASSLNVYYLTKAIATASWKYWVRWLVNFGGWMCIGVFNNAFLKYIERLIALQLRANLTRMAHKKYMENNSFYRAVVMKEGKLDSIDQRIVASISSFSTRVAFTFGHSFKPLLEFVLSLSEASVHLGLVRPLLLFAWNIFFDQCLRLISPRMAPVITSEEEMEGGFRHAHSRLIGSAEEIAFLRGGRNEQRLLDERLDTLVDTHRSHAVVRLCKDLATQVFKFNGPLVGGCFVHIPFLNSPQLSDVERISQFRATETLMLRCGSSFGEILMLSNELEELAGYTHRLSEMFEALALQKDPASSISRDAVDTIVLNSVSVFAPEESKDTNGRLLIKDLNLTVRSQNSILVTGPNGSGKSSMFRIIAGLWPISEGGTVSTPPIDRLLVLPQHPYLVLGCLRDQVSYPHILDSKSDALIVECLRRCGLGTLLDQPDGLNLVHEEWSAILSGGEQQKIGFARLMFARRRQPSGPFFAILDECTSAIAPVDEMKLYQQVMEMNITALSICHRLGLKRFHQLELHVKGDGLGGWELSPLVHDQ